VDVYASSFRPMRNTISGNEGRGTMKIVVDARTDKVVGIHIVGPESGEIMQVRLQRLLWLVLQTDFSRTCRGCSILCCVRCLHNAALYQM
jgi:glutathione reductase (NADPH)